MTRTTSASGGARFVLPGAQGLELNRRAMKTAPAALDAATTGGNPRTACPGDGTAGHGAMPSGDESGAAVPCCSASEYRPHAARTRHLIRRGAVCTRALRGKVLPHCSHATPTSGTPEASSKSAAPPSRSAEASSKRITPSGDDPQREGMCPAAFCATAAPSGPDPFHHGMCANPLRQHPSSDGIKTGADGHDPRRNGIIVRMDCQDPLTDGISAKRAGPLAERLGRDPSSRGIAASSRCRRPVWRGIPPFSRSRMSGSRADGSISSCGPARSRSIRTGPTHRLARLHGMSAETSPRLPRRPVRCLPKPAASALTVPT